MSANVIKKEFKVKVGDTEAPLPKLLDLIEKRKLSINEVSLTKVAEEFIKYFANKNISKDDLAEFVSIASTLILIKSRSLLPELPLVEEEQDAEELKRRLEALKLLRQKTKEMKLNARDKKRYKILHKKIKFKPEFKELKISLNEINLAKENILNKIIEPILKNKKVTIKRKETYSINSILRKLEKSLQEKSSISFHSIKFKNKEDKLIHFLAILELVKKGVAKVNIIDSKKFIIKQENLNVPRYE